QLNPRLRCSKSRVLIPPIGYDHNLDVSLQATRQLLVAVSSSLAYVSRRLTSSVLRLAKWIRWTLVGATLVALSAALTMLWALFPVPLDEWSRPNRSAILVEAATGEQLGRIGPFVQLYGCLARSSSQQG